MKCDFLANNSFPMREWHVEHMEKTIVKFVTGLSEDAFSQNTTCHKISTKTKSTNCKCIKL